MNSDEFRRHAELEDTHWWFRARREIIIDYIMRVLPPFTGRRIVEIGCGTGGNLKAMAKYYDVLGVDISDEALDYARLRVPVPLYSGDFRQVLDGLWPGIDGVLLADVLEHIEDDHAFLGDLARLLKEGAFIFIAVPANQFLWSKHDEALGHLRRYDRRSLDRICRGLPVEEVYSTPFNSLLLPPIAFARLMQYRSPGPRSSLQKTSPIANTVLYQVFNLERKLLRHMRMPIGVSWLLVLRKRAK